jgi:hypothetical protein
MRCALVAMQLHPLHKMFQAPLPVKPLQALTL